MDIRMTVLASFSAQHQVPGDSLCERGDGHSWRVEVSVPAHLDPATGRLFQRDELVAAVTGFAAELHHGSINDMLPGSPASADGIALALRERLLMVWPSSRVTVWMDNLAVTVE